MRRTVLAIGFVVALAAATVFSTPAAATTQGPCTIAIQGNDIAGRSASSTAQAIPIAADRAVRYTIAHSSGEAVSTWRFDLAFGPLTINLARGQGDGTQSIIQGEGGANQFAWLGSGLFVARASATFADGSSCEGAAIIDVLGNPVGTAMGITAAVAVLAGTTGMVVGWLAAYRNMIEPA